MLSRVGDRIFWMSRLIERAENTARILDVTSNVVLCSTPESQAQNLEAPLTITGMRDAYFARHERLTLPCLIDFMGLDAANPSSIYNCLKDARENAHAVRWQITSEMWETINAAWIELNEFRRDRVTGPQATRFFDWVKERSHLFRGVTYGTIMRGEAFNFSRIGTFIERADNTARILDVKYYVLLPSTAWVGSSLDNQQWETVLRSVAGDRAYRWLNAGGMDSRGIAEFLILDERFPRSLAFSYNKLRSNMAGLAREYGHETAAHELLREKGAWLHQMSVDRIFEYGLHEFLVDFIAGTRQIGNAIAADFRFIE